MVPVAAASAVLGASLNHSVQCDRKQNFGIGENKSNEILKFSKTNITKIYTNFSF